jgi:hypothetical protein
VSATPRAPGRGSGISGEIKTTGIAPIPESYFTRPRGPSGLWRWGPIMATVVGFVVSFWGHDVAGAGATGS